jgi:hypothetical protein
MRHPQPGEVFAKNGKEFVVHFVEGDQVYGALWRAGCRRRPKYGPDGIPVGAIALVRVSLRAFWRDCREGA